MSDPKENPATESADETPADAGEAAGAAAAESAADETPEGGDRVAELEAEVADLKDRLLRAVADAENTRKRAERDKQDASKYAVTSFARDVLTVGDNMRRAIDALPESDREGAPDGVKNLIAGIEMTEREFLSVLERHGVKAINPLGEKFDPNHHQAMFEVEHPDKPNGTVVEVVATGYVIGERLLRPAMVGVSKGGTAAAKADTSAADTKVDEKPEGDGGGASQGPGSTIDTKA